MIKYRHRNCLKSLKPATFCYDLPPASLFKELFIQGETLITFPFGMTLVHKNDSYERSVGRDYSLRAMRGTTFEVMGIKLENKKQYFTLQNRELDIVIKISTNLEHNTTILHWIEFNEFYF